MSIEELSRKVDDLQRTLDALRASAVHQNGEVLAVKSLRTRGVPSGDYYEIAINDENRALPVLQTIVLGKKGI